MIRVAPAMEPAQFDERVRQPGLASIARLAAKAGSEDSISPSQFKPYWRRALDDFADELQPHLLLPEPLYPKGRRDAKR